MHDLIIIGAGGHAKVIADIATANDYNIIGFLDDNCDIQKLLNFDRLGKIEDAPLFSNKAQFIIAIGNNAVRKEIAQKYNLSFATLIHPTAVIGSQVEIHKGTVVMPLAVINSSSKIGEHCIINSASVIEHDNTINNFTHISPNATLCGTVKIGKNCHIGANATVINNTNICDDCVIGAGAVVTKNIEKSGTYIGIPAKVIK
ncbi:MAG: acetyltransferase [Clostridia bacterium]|nr:acetyltransferase [Clostridia bacterium]